MPKNPDFGTFGRYNELPFDQMPPEQKAAYDFTMKLRGQVPGPHKIWVSNPKLSETIVPTGAYYQKHSTLSKAEIEIATNLINGRWLAAYSNYEHEKIGEEQGPPAAREGAGADCGLADLLRRPPAAGRLRDRLDLDPAARCAERTVSARTGFAGGRRARRFDDAPGLVHGRVVYPDGLRRAV